MEKKDSMGLPPSPPPASFNGIHAKSTQTPSQFTPGPPTLVHNPTPLRPDATRAAALVSDLPGRTIAATPLAAASPPPHIPDHTSSTTAIVPHPGSLMTPAVYMGAETVKKKRGRPRKYAPDGTVAITIKPVIPGPLSPLHKRGRGRPPGSGKKQQLAALGEFLCGSVGAGFTPHAITVATGEDVAAKIMSFSQQGPRGICILSANGAISNVTLGQPSTSGGTVTYEGRFEILSLSGSFLVTESGGTRSRTGGLSVSLAGPDGRVMGGGVAGLLMAASPVQVVVGSFLCSSKKGQSKPSKVEGTSKISTSGVANLGGTSAAPEVFMNDVGDDKLPADSPPLNQSSGNAVSSNDESPLQTRQMIAVHMGWSGSQGDPLESKHNTDIDISSPAGQ